MTKITLETETKKIVDYTMIDQTIFFRPMFVQLCDILNTEHTFKFDFLPKDHQMQPLTWKYRFVNRKDTLYVYIYNIKGHSEYAPSLFTNTMSVCLDAHMADESFDEIMNAKCIKIATRKIEDFDFINNDILDFTATHWFEDLNQQVVDVIQAKVDEYSNHFFNLQRIALQNAYDHQKQYDILVDKFDQYAQIMLDGWQLAYDSKKMNIDFDLAKFNNANIKMLASVINEISNLYHQINPQIEIVTQDMIETQLVTKLNQIKDRLLEYVEQHLLDLLNLFIIYPTQILNQEISTLADHD